MALLHNTYTTNLSLEDAVLAVLSNQSVEADMAVSGSFFLYEDDFEPVWDSYEDYFQNTVTELTEILGHPVYRGHCSMPDIHEWAWLYDVETLVHLVVWERDGIKLYLRYEQEDKELPIFIALGCEGCKPTGNDYPEPPRHLPTPAEIEAAFLRELRTFYDKLGIESISDKCRKEGCCRGAIPLSVFCRIHHFEMIKCMPCPFND